MLQTAHSAWDVKKDGRLRSDVRRPEHPGIVLKFDVFNSQARRYEQMSFECDQFTEWKANVRAVADAMEALRKVNRYGVSGGGKSNAHYEGYKALPSGEITTSDDSLKNSAEYIAKHSGGFHWTTVAQNKDYYLRYYKLAVKKLHPDNQFSGSHEKFIELQKAKIVLDRHFDL